MARTKASTGGLLPLPEKVAVFGAKQPVPRCLPNSDLSLVVEMQVVDSSSLSLKSRAWTKIDLFDANNRLHSGRFKVWRSGSWEDLRSEPHGTASLCSAPCARCPFGRTWKWPR